MHASLFIAVSCFMQATSLGQVIEFSDICVLLKSAAEEVLDVSFIYEGERKLGPQGKRQSIPSRWVDASFQGIYAMRRDDAVFWDLYVRSKQSDVLNRSTWALLGTTLERFDRSADVKNPASGVRKSQEGLGSFLRAYSPQWFLYLWMNRSLDTFKGFTYEFKGWETIDGHRCLCFDLHHGRPAESRRAPDLPSGALTDRYWLDIDRGCHYLRVERLSGSRPLSRIDGITLTSFIADDGNAVWLPVTATLSTFFWEGTYSDDPVIVETYQVVHHTVRVRQKLPDNLFNARANWTLTRSEALKKAEREFEATPHLRNDLAGISERLDKQLARVDLEAKEVIVNSTPLLSGESIVQLALTATGGLVIGAAGYFHLRNNRR